MPGFLSHYSGFDHDATRAIDEGATGDERCRPTATERRPSTAAPAGVQPAGLLRRYQHAAAEWLRAAAGTTVPDPADPDVQIIAPSHGA